MKHLLSVCVLFIFLVSCDSKTENKEQVTAPAISPATNPISPVNNDSSAVNNDSGVALNPQHGQPGHRCDIAVGAPLSTPVANSTIQPAVTPTVSPAITPVSIPTNTSVTSPTNSNTKVTSNLTTATGALNPQHGQPGHRCDIAVGAPLNSKPTQ